MSSTPILDASGVEITPLLEGNEPGLLHQAVRRVRTACRLGRAALFKSLFPLRRSTRVLDLGGANGTYAHALLASTPVRPENVCVADIDEAAVRSAARTFGYTAAPLDAGEPLPFADGAFDIVLCSSVLEHVTVPPDQVWLATSGRDFRRRAVREQSRFAAEIRRVAQGYFVQVPYRGFPIEAHTWLPFVSYLPRAWQCRVIATSNRYWIKKTVPDFYLPTAAEMSSYFPDARMLRERMLKMTKSIIAVKTI